MICILNIHSLRVTHKPKSVQNTVIYLLLQLIIQDAIKLKTVI